MLSWLATCDPDFPIRECDWLTQQAELTLIILRNSRANPNLFVWASLFGNYNFNRCPLVPPGTKVLLHSKLSQHKIWAFRGEHGWYIVPALDHYRCIKGYIRKIHVEIITDTATLIPEMVPIPNSDIDTHLKRTVDDLLHVLQGKSNIFSSRCFN